MKRSHPENIAAKYFNPKTFAELAPEDKARHIACVRAGFENPDAPGLGCYALAPLDYDSLAPFFDQVVQECHGADANAVHVIDWDTSQMGEGQDGVLDAEDLLFPKGRSGGGEDLSMRVRVGRK